VTKTASNTAVTHPVKKFPAFDQHEGIAISSQESIIGNQLQPRFYTPLGHQPNGSTVVLEVQGLVKLFVLNIMVTDHRLYYYAIKIIKT
jgi:hypothetical protein